MIEIILRDDVPSLGFKDDIVRVRDGYALNYLIPQGLAIMATPSAKKSLAENLRQAARKREAIKGEAQRVAELLNALNLTIPMLVGKGGRIYGSITPLQVANQLKESGFDIDRRKIVVPEDIKEVGDYTIKIILHKEVQVELRVSIVSQADYAAATAAAAAEQTA